MSTARAWLSVAVLVASAGAVLAASPEPPAGASSCTGCHATGGKVDTAVPGLVGRPAADIMTLMQAFKTGQKSSTVMDRIAKGFTDSEVQAIADWYAQQK